MASKLGDDIPDVRPRTRRVFRPVQDFEKDERGNIVKFEDPVKTQDAIGQRVREYMIAIERLNIVRNRLQECYSEAGVNHQEVSCLFLIFPSPFSRCQNRTAKRSRKSMFLCSRRKALELCLSRRTGHLNRIEI